MDIEHRNLLNFITKAFGAGIVNKHGTEVCITCPICNPENAAKKKLNIILESQVYHCWVCDASGRGLHKLTKKYRNKHYPEYLKKFSSIKNKKKEEEESNDLLVELPKDFKLLAQNLNENDPDIKAVINYAKSRGFSIRDLWYFKVGTCKFGKYRRKLILPSFDSEGELNYIVSRAIDPEVKYKYYNFGKPRKEIIFNDLNIDWRKELTVVEGPLDLIKCNDNATCILGSSFGESYALFKKIISHGTPITLALDPDAISKSYKYAKLLSEYGIEIRMLDVEPFSDVGEMSKEEFEIRKQNAKIFNERSRLIHKISKIRSGSLI